MLWFTLWFMVILKIPALYLAYVIWWAVKDPPAPSPGPGFAGYDAGPGVIGPPRRRGRGRLPRPHGGPARRPAPLAPRTRASRAA
jgi:hypothetical protein